MSLLVIGTLAYDTIEITDSLRQLATSVDCVCYGSVAQRQKRSRETLNAILDFAESSSNAHLFFDINLRKNCYTLPVLKESIRRADIVKLNEEELVELAKLLGLPFK